MLLLITLIKMLILLQQQLLLLLLAEALLHSVLLPGWIPTTGNLLSRPSSDRPLLFFFPSTWGILLLRLLFPLALAVGRQLPGRVGNNSALWSDRGPPGEPLWRFRQLMPVSRLPPEAPAGAPDVVSPSTPLWIIDRCTDRAALFRR